MHMMYDIARGTANNGTNTARFYHLFSLVLVFLCQALFLFHYVHFIQVFFSGYQHSISRILLVSKPFTCDFDKPPSGSDTLLIPWQQREV
jgi:hypothetical protein